MENREMNKEELILMLSDIHVELEKIEAGIQASVNDFWDEWFTQQVSRLSECGDKLVKLEERLDQIDEILNEENPSLKKRTGTLRLKPGY